MTSSEDLLGVLLRRFKEKGFAQAKGLNRFGYIKQTEKSVYVTRENGKDTPIPLAKIKETIEITRKHHGAYSKGPGALKQYGIIHINSPLYALLHLLTLKEIVE